MLGNNNILMHWTDNGGKFLKRFLKILNGKSIKNYGT